MELHCAVVFSVLCLSVSNVWSVDVITQYGPVRGQTVAVDNGQSVSNVDVFRGLRYAKDMSGPRRFNRPEPPDPWVEVFEAFEPGPPCPQGASSINFTNPTWEQNFSEDCLHVDIYTPNALAVADSYPVLVFIHGGGYTSGGSIQYPGHFLAAHDVVVVVVNYRLGALGFSYTGNAASPGNVGMWDMREALSFVNNNIRNFGGDPHRITVAGQSAGGASTGLLVVSPQTKDMFQQAIPQSGSEINMWAYNRPESYPANYTRQIAEDLGCLSDDDFQMMDCLRLVPFEAFVENATVRCEPGYICSAMGPVIDGEGGFLPKSPQELRADGDIMTGPLMTGITQDDASFLVPLFAPSTLVGCCNRSRFEDILRNRVLRYFEPRFSNEILDAVFEALNWFYTFWPYAYENEANRDAFIRLMTDVGFGVGWDWEMKQHYQKNNTFGYVFDYMSVNRTTPDWIGTPHFAELPYIWGYPLLQYNEEIRESSYLDDDYYDQDDVAQSLYMMELFTNFIKYGDPAYTDVEKPTGGVTSWPTFDEQDYSVLYISNDVIDTVQEYRQREYGFWVDYMNYLLLGEISGEGELDAAMILDKLWSLIPALEMDLLNLMDYKTAEPQL